MDKYILDAKGEPLEVWDTEAWAQWFENSESRQVARDTIGGVAISTVFLGLDHSFHNDGPPILWETMIFGPEDIPEELKGFQMRYRSREQAVKGHQLAVEKVKSLVPITK